MLISGLWKEAVYNHIPIPGRGKDKAKSGILLRQWSIAGGDVKESWGRLSSLPLLPFQQRQAGKPAPQKKFGPPKSECSNHKEMEMDRGKLTVMALLRAKPGKEEAVKQGLLALLEPTKKEVGCINYNLHQSADTPGLFMFYENWRSRKDLDEHVSTPHMQDFMRKGREVLSGPPELTLWEMIDSSD